MFPARPSPLWRFFLLFVALVALQWPFLAADADLGLGYSRGPYTDEGLYTQQVRNALLTGRLDLSESDAALKNPLFAVAAWAVLGLFGDSMLVVRGALVVVCSAVLAALAAGRGAFARLLAWAIPFGFLSYFPFHYGHLALAEMLSCAAIVASLAVLHHRLAGGGAWTLPASGVLLLVAYALKLQFAYAAAIPSLAIVIVIALRRFAGLAPERRLWTDLAWTVAIGAVCFALYLGLWVWPNRSLFTAVSDQLSSRSSGLAALPRAIALNAWVVMRQPGVWSVLLLAGAAAFTLRRAWRSAAADPARLGAWFALVAPPLAWLALESHKLTMHYLPSRYFVSALVAVSLTAAAVLVLRTRPERVASGRQTGLHAVLGLALLLNAGLYAKSLVVRTHVVHDTQRALAADGRWQGKLAMGSWAPTLFWGTGTRTLPIWDGAYNDHGIEARFKPDALVAEADQDDSHGALRDDGIVLPPRPERTLRIGRWDVGVYPWPPAPAAAASAPGR